MSVQETVTNATTNLSANTAAVIVGLVALAALALGVEQVLDLSDFRLPWRQLMVGRTLRALTLSCRFFYAIAGGYFTLRRG